ncbi:c-type cytochrome [Aurantimonas sp. 22II-16-19i]|uniref:c-type cytochrome n=1 Tax=Aurantimonas sp. 22II-16-19i TaxID=1317114 RepID=UPI0009F7B239|nr:c-type cytochrome [Aurantimonas sp. 22II-16-19i]ORE98913.1 putative cytochrome c, class I [Aurantimonas sp. 22II-16-19i]
MKLSVTLTRRRVVAAIVLVAAAPFALAASGLVSIGASSGHYAPVGWFLHWTMQQTVSRRSWLVEKPEDLDLFDPALVQRGSGHFATGCAPCHAAPGVRQSEVVEHMTPMPPQLHVGDQVAEWADRELFWIVQHGIKYSGMPAWPTQERPDEVWSMVAFLRALPDMTPERYRELALGIDAGGAPDAVDMEAGGEALGGLDGILREAVADCARCHGADGMGRGPKGAFPVIAGQPQAYLAATLKAFQMGTRQSGYMQSAAARYDDAVLERLAAYYADQPAAAPGNAAVSQAAEEAGAGSALEPAQASNVRAMTEVFQIDPAAATGFPIGRDATLALGRRIAETGLPERKIAACDSCHGPDGIARNPLFPRLDGQPFWYLKTHLELWKEGHRDGTRFAHLMDPIAINMTPEQIEAVSLWYESREVRPLDREAVSAPAGG